jgi:hypothetical protein
MESMLLPLCTNALYSLLVIQIQETVILKYYSKFHMLSKVESKRGQYSLNISQSRSIHHPHNNERYKIAISTCCTTAGVNAV